MSCTRSACKPKPKENIEWILCKRLRNIWCEKTWFRALVNVKLTHPHAPWCLVAEFWFTNHSVHSKHQQMRADKYCHEKATCSSKSRFVWELPDLNLNRILNISTSKSKAIEWLQQLNLSDVFNKRIWLCVFFAYSRDSYKIWNHFNVFDLHTRHTHMANLLLQYKSCPINWMSRMVSRLNYAVGAVVLSCPTNREKMVKIQFDNAFEGINISNIAVHNLGSHHTRAFIYWKGVSVHLLLSLTLLSK